MCSKRGRAFCIYPNLGLQQALYDFHVSCTHKSKGCEWTGELRELNNHLNSDPPADKSLQGCPFTLIKCPLGCAECESGLYRKDVESHVKFAQLKSFEEKVLNYQSTTEQLKTQFEEFKRNSEYLALRTANLEATVLELSVENGELGNEIKALKHPSSMEDQLPNEYVTGTYKPSGAEFIMAYFKEFRKDSDMWYSPHFYTHPHGYKMCLSVDANGIGCGEGTHLSVFVYLMRGEFDSQLKWPFQGSVTVKLVNQEEDRDHVEETVSFTRSTPDKHCERVTMGERSCNGWGRHKFMSLAKLQPKYLKNDCIRLCIKKVELE